MIAGFRPTLAREGLRLTMQFFFDFFPIVAFFVAYKLKGIYVATGVILIASVIQIAVHWIRTRSVSRMHLTSAGLVLLFGGITLALENPLYIQWKPTILFWLMGIAFLASGFIGEKPLVQRMFQSKAMREAMSAPVELTRGEWRNLNLTWVIYFAIVGAANLYVVYNYSENTWVNFKLFGLLGTQIVFVVLQTVWIFSKIRDREPADEET